MNSSHVTAERLREVCNYCPDTGIFTWRALRKKCPIGKPTGCIERRGYVAIKIDYQRYWAHRLAWLYMTGAWPDDDIDHIDRNKTNNAWANLRAATTAQNLQNAGKKKSNTSGVPGVSWSKIHSRWVVRIRVHPKRITIGYFRDFDQATAARLAAERKYFTHSPACALQSSCPDDPGPQGGKP